MKRRFDERIEAEICIRYRGGESSILLAKEYGTSKTSILGLLKRHDIPRRSTAEAVKLSSSDKNNVVLPDMANLSPTDQYWLGFLLGDGCVFKPKTQNQSATMSIGLKTSDKYHIERLRKYFNSNRKILDQGKGTSCLQIASDKLVEYLEHFGIHQRKSQKEKAHPALVESRDFWRGVIDADGSIYEAENQVRLSLTGSEELCNQFKQYLVSAIDKDFESSPIKTKEGCFELVINGNQKANKAIKHFYYNACMALTRKLILAMQHGKASFEFRRTKDISGVSGTGVVADGKVFRNGKVALAWCASDTHSVVVYDTLQDMFKIHNHEENSYIIWIDSNQLEEEAK